MKSTLATVLALVAVLAGTAMSLPYPAIQEKVPQLELQDWTFMGAVGDKLYFTYLPANISYWYESQVLCHSYDLTPGQINNPAEKDLVHDFLIRNIDGGDGSTHFNSRQVWLDAVDFWTEGRYYSFQTHRPVNKYLPWAIDKQPDGRYHENCVSYCGGCEPGKPERDGFHDSWCHTEHTIRPLCEIRVGGGDSFSSIKVNPTEQIQRLFEFKMQMAKFNITLQRQ